MLPKRSEHNKEKIKMKKVYAKTIPAEYSSVNIQDYLELDAEAICICGNKDFNGANDDPVRDAKRAYADIVCEYEDSFYRKNNGETFSEDEMDNLREIAKNDPEDDFIKAFLGMYYGFEQPHRKVTIRGYCQSDWQYAYVPYSASQGLIDEIECYYFNLGTEVLIDDEHSYDDDTELSPDDIDGYYVYVPSCDEDKIKNFVAWEKGVKPEDVVLYLFDGWKRTPTYRAC